MAKFIKTSRNSYKFVDEENHIYEKQRMCGNKIYWRCEKYGSLLCRARLVTIETELHPIVNVKSKSGQHNHTSSKAEVEARIFSNKIKARALNTQESSRAILSDELRETDEGTMRRMPKLHSLSRKIGRVRLAENKAPPIPKARSGFRIPG